LGKKLGQPRRKRKRKCSPRGSLVRTTIPMKEGKRGKMEHWVTRGAAQTNRRREKKGELGLNWWGGAQPLSKKARKKKTKKA